MSYPTCNHLKEDGVYPNGIDLELPPEAALQAAEQPADPPQTPKQHVRLARMPQRTASQADSFYHIPKKLGREKGYDEETYETARMLFDLQEAQREDEADRADEERRSRLSPPTGSFVNPGRNLSVTDVA